MPRKLYNSNKISSSEYQNKKMRGNSVVHSFMKCGIAMPISGSRVCETLININALPNYRIDESADEEEIEFILTQYGKKAKLSAFSP